MLQHGGGIGGRQPMLYNNFHVNVNEIMTRANYTFNGLQNNNPIVV
jgi:hypothetical protein